MCVGISLDRKRMSKIALMAGVEYMMRLLKQRLAPTALYVTQFRGGGLEY